MSGGHFMKLLGLLWAQFPEEWDIKNKQTLKISPSDKVIGWSGMSLVVPAWENSGGY